jgi:hypothetical protein
MDRAATNPQPNGRCTGQARSDPMDGLRGGCGNSDLAAGLPVRSIVAQRCDASADVWEAAWVLSKLAYLTLCRSIQLLATLGSSVTTAG